MTPPAKGGVAADAAVPPAHSADGSPTQLAKAALRRLAQDKLEPTPDNYARAYQAEQGVAPPAGDSLATLIESIVRGIERGGKQWTLARKKDSLQRVLSGSRGDANRLQQRLRQLVGSWETDNPADAAAVPEATEAPSATTEAAAPGSATSLVAPNSAPVSGEPIAAEPAGTPTDASPRVVAALGQTVVRALPSKESHGDLAAAIAQAAQRIQREGASESAASEVEGLCERADWVLQHREHLFDQISGLCLELTASLTDLAEDDSWARGQCDAMRLTVEEGLTARGVKSVNELLRTTRVKQAELRSERDSARDALKQLINRMLSELDALGSQTGRFHESVGRYADVIERADTLESLAGAVREMVEESRTVQGLVDQTQRRLHDERMRASDLSQRVNELEGELRRLSDEVSTDQLTQIANRRGLLQAFDLECARLQRLAIDDPSGASAPSLSIGLLDIDNFKRLNDELGHAAGDQALKSLAATVAQTLRPTDVVARYGGEEFVVLLPDTPVDEGQQILTRLQRSLTGGLFMHENKQVFVTFSAGVTAFRVGERIEQALERADIALYQAKRAGKNRTLIG
ncbi:MAG: GGDEF domain-containing protein [Burkholderiales bacterium PBB1]|nr:MAG: GGDEF domain-containing protein [Burkholderiales bacterium PBB1]